MTFVCGVLGALLMIGSFFAGSALAVAETADKRAGRTPTPVDRAWTAKFKVVVRIGFWGGLLLTWVSAVVAVT
jgi:hypothetical protein